jgi:hypothetical protein
MTPEMTFDNVHLDHIIPVSRFNLDDEEELLKSCHFTNLQLLLCKDTSAPGGVAAPKILPRDFL